jgi:RNA polymerase sigma-54 factor
MSQHRPLGPRQSQTPTQTQNQRLSLNSGLMTSLGVLRADAGGLTRFLEEEAARNPHLRLDPPPAPTMGEWLPRWASVLPGLGGGGAAYEHAAAAGPSLLVHVTTVIEAMFRIPRDRQIALRLAESLEPSGWLGQSPVQIAQDIGAALTEVEQVLTRLQKIEPAGLFARNLSECLALQLTEAGHMDAGFAVILDNLDLLARGDLARLARLCGQGEAELALRFRVIRGLNPKPGTQFAAFGADPQREPDLVARPEGGGGWSVALNHSALPSLHVVKSEAGNAEALRAAHALGRMVEARNTTLLRVGREVLQHQQAALASGAGGLAPLTMAEVATRLTLSESTISRVVAGASVDTPFGTWWLRRLFSGRVGDKDGDGPAVSAAALRDRLARLIAAEDRSAPLSDARLATALAADGPAIARRTVAKYREMLAIAPAHRRKRRS